MPKKSTASAKGGKTTKSPAKRKTTSRTVKKSTKKTVRKTTTRRKKPVLKTEAPAIEVEKTTDTETATPKNREQIVEIRRVEHMPVSPYVIEFRAEDEVVGYEPTPASQLPAAREVQEPLVPNLQALAEFFGEQTEEATQPVVAAEVETPIIEPIQEKITSAPKSTPPENIRIPTQTTPLGEGDIPKHIRRPNEQERHKKTFRLPSLPTFHLPRPKFRISSQLTRATATFAIIALLFTLPATGLHAYTKFEQTKAALALRGQAVLAGFNLPSGAPQELSTALAEATHNFTQAKKELENAVGIFHSLLPFIPAAGTAYKSGGLALDAGAHLTEAGRIITGGMSTLSEATIPLGTRMIHFEESLRAAFPLIRAAELELDRVRVSSLPTQVKTQLPAVASIVTSVRQSFTETLELLPALQAFLGGDAPKRYLVVFQNPHELRATGGFIGSFALLDVDQGEITNLEVPGGGPYDLACCLKERVIAPAPLHLIEPHWQFHDANWFPDFPTSAEKLMWFYLKSGGPSVDGVIAINADLIPKLLEILGPIEMPKYGRTFTAANFIAETQKIVELEYDKEENRPKAVIGDLAPMLLERMLTAPPEALLPILESFGSSLKEKTVQFYSTASETQKTFSRMGWTGEVKQTNGDYLLVASSNIAGGKSNAKIETHISHRTTIGTDGSMTGRVEITKTHTGNKGELFSGVRNVDYVRVFVPAGSELLEAYGFETPADELFDKPDSDYTADEDLARLVQHVGYDARSGTTTATLHKKTVFGNWMQVDPGESVTTTLSYRLPIKLVASQKPGVLGSALGVPERLPYTFLAQAQSGAHATLKHEVIYPYTLTPAWGTEKISQSLTSDIFAALLFER